MCLIISANAKQRIAEEDIPIVKLVIRAIDMSTCIGRWVTPYKGKDVPEDGIMIAEPISEDIPVCDEIYPDVSLNDCHVFTIKGGAIHCYSLTKLMPSAILFSLTPFFIMGVIPKGTKYYYNASSEEYAAQRIELDMSKVFDYEEFEEYYQQTFQ